VARLVLVGLPGVGKTTVAHALAVRWGCDEFDTDALVSTSVDMPSAQYLRQFGETHFRERELDALHTALVGDAVVATGAGIITTAPARELITREFAIWLDADDDTLIGRVSAGDDRPLLGDDRAEGVRRLRREREKWYRESSRVRVTATGTLDEVLERILAVTKELTP
jgi:3-dehydroquinate synthase/shikimate kinase/3-dehydroquinate synthase